jgi:hypothetical protein
VAADEVDDLAHAQRLREARLLRRDADPLARASVGGRQPEQRRVALVGAAQPGEHAQRGGLARAVRAEQGERLAALHAQVDSVEGDRCCEPLRHARQLGGSGPRERAGPSERTRLPALLQRERDHEVVGRMSRDRRPDPARDDEQAAEDRPGQQMGRAAPAELRVVRRREADRRQRERGEEADHGRERSDPEPAPEDLLHRGAEDEVPASRSERRRALAAEGAQRQGRPREPGEEQGSGQDGAGQRHRRRQGAVRSGETDGRRRRDAGRPADDPADEELARVRLRHEPSGGAVPAVTV